MNKLSTTLTSLSSLIENLYSSRCLYAKLVGLYPDYADIINPLNKRMDEFLYKLMNEYKRLSKNEYKLNGNITDTGSSSPANGILDACLKNEKKLITMYSETIGEDVLWEVLPVLAHHLSYLKTYQGSITGGVELYSKQSINSQVAM